MKLRRPIRWLAWTACLISLALSLLALHSWRRSYAVIDRAAWGRLRFDDAPMTAPPRGMWLEQPNAAGTVWWQGTFREWRGDIFHGRVLLRFGTRPWYAHSREITPEMSRETGWHTSRGDIGDAISYNIPRGNVWLSADDFHWNGIATYPYYINGDAAQFVMLPHWLLLTLSAAPMAFVCSFVGARRLRRTLRRRGGRCTHCNYEIRGLTGPCPECGRPTTTPA